MLYFAKVTVESAKLLKVDRSHRQVTFRKSLSKETFQCEKGLKEFHKVPSLYLIGLWPIELANRFTWRLYLVHVL